MKIRATFEVDVKMLLDEVGDDGLSAEREEDILCAAMQEFGWTHDSGLFIEDAEILPEHDHPNGDKEGICPVCGAPIMYENRELVDGDEFSCEWTCDACGAYGSMAEMAVFQEHYDIYDAEGNRFLEGRTEGLDGEAASGND